MGSNRLNVSFSRSDLLNFLQEAVQANGMHVQLRSEYPLEWDEVALKMTYIPVSYSAAMIDYQMAYWSQQEAGWEVIDISLIIMHDQRACGIWPLSLRWGAQGIRFGSNGGDLEPPLFAQGLSEKTLGQLTVRCQNVAQELLRRLGINELKSVHSFVCAVGLGHWYERLKQAGAVVAVRHDLFVDLAPDMVEIKRNIRKSYKSLITNGERLWRVELLESEHGSTWDEYRNLHHAVSGRVTRNLESWEKQHASISKGDAFLVYLRDEVGKMVGGGLFYCTRDEAVYAVGAYDRALFDKPIGHVVQYRAMEIMKRRGIRWYRIGQRPYAGEIPEPTLKELAIADFKQGFASHLMPRYLIESRFKLG